MKDDGRGRSRVSSSFAACERLARRAARNFYPAFRLLPRPQRLAMCALYAFMRITDDLADEPGCPTAKAAALAEWRRATDAALRGEYRHRVHPALHATVARYGVPAECLTAVVDGVEQDLAPVRFATFAELYPYCYRVASAVGLACIHVWGFTDERAKPYAESAGIAFQLTNILRDLGEDRARGRVYLPRDELERFGCCPDRLCGDARDPHFQALMRFQVERTRQYYDAAAPLAGLLRPAGRAVFGTMAATYRGLLDRIEACGYDVFARRVRLSRWRQLGLLARAFPVRWGWA